VINKKIVVTTVAFSKDKELVDKLKSFFADVKVNIEGKRFSKDELIEYLKDADGAIVGLDKIDESILAHTPKLKAISKYGVGLDNINFTDSNKYKIEILHTQGVNKTSVAEEALGLMLMLCRNLYVTSNQLKEGIWNKNGGVQLSGKTVGIIGVGHIGKEIVRLLKPFGCKILVNDIIEQKEYYDQNGLIEVTKEEMLKSVDILTLHTPLTDALQYFINIDTLKMMKTTALIINTARGGLIKQDDLKYALKQGLIAGAAIDVYEEEPPTDGQLLELTNLINTPHIGGNAIEAVKEMGQAAIDNIVNYFKE